jgi:hypothetical protein
MGSSSPPTRFSGGPIEIVGTVDPPGTGSAVQPDLPFSPMHYPTVSTLDTLLQEKLDAALDAQKAAGRFGANSDVAFSLIVISKTGDHKYAGRSDDKMHFSASLVKVAALYAAHELLAAARRLARRKGFADAAAFLAALTSTFDSQITAAAVSAVRNLVTDPALMGPVPKYDLIFSVTNTGIANEPDVEFTADFENDLHSMIALGTNEGASRCIRKLSYAYINAALIHGGFFNPDVTPQNGIWLAADYLGDKNLPKTADAKHIPYVRIDSDNDCGLLNGIQTCGVGQISTTRRMSNLFALIELGRVPNADTKMAVDPNSGVSVPDACMKMRALLAEPKPGRADVPWVDPGNNPRRLISVVPKFDVRHDKIGLGDLKRGGEVRSEGLIVEWKGQRARLDALNFTGKLAISWQNLVGVPPTRFDGIAQTINDTFTSYMAALP